MIDAEKEKANAVRRRASALLAARRQEGASIMSLIGTTGEHQDRGAAAGGGGGGSNGGGGGGRSDGSTPAVPPAPPAAVPVPYASTDSEILNDILRRTYGSDAGGGGSGGGDYLNAATGTQLQYAQSSVDTTQARSSPASGSAGLRHSPQRPHRANYPTTPPAASSSGSRFRVATGLQAVSETDDGYTVDL